MLFTLAMFSVQAIMITPATAMIIADCASPV
jgi:hypothetical protein